MTRRNVLAALLAVSLLALACGKKGGGEDEDEGAKEAAVPEVTVAKVERGSLAGSLVVNGSLVAPPNKDAKIAALVPGRIAKVLVAEGDSVKPGQVLAELENAPLRDQERQAEAAVAQAKANVENAQISAQRNEGLLQRGIAARKEVEDARTQLAVNQAALSQAEAALSSAKTQLARSTVRAPFAGTVVHRFIGVGDQVDGTAAQPIVEVADIDVLELLGTVPVARLSEVRVGEQFALPDSSQQAKVVAILPAVDPATNNGSVRIRIANPKHQLKLGQYLTLELPVKGSKGLIVPRQAIYPDESGEPHVYRVKGDDAESVAVELGGQTKDKAEVLSGVNEGDTVIVTGGYGLPEKSKVHVKQ